MSHKHTKLNDVIDSNILNMNDKEIALPLKAHTLHHVSAGKKMTFDNSAPNHHMEQLECMRSKTFSVVTKFQNEHLYMKRSTHLQVIRMDFRRVREDSCSRKNPKKCWKDGQIMTEKYDCSEKPHVEERRVRQLKIQDFVDQLRRHKQSSFVSSSQPVPSRILRIVNSKPGDGKDKKKGKNISDKLLPMSKLSKENSKEMCGKKTCICCTPDEFSQTKDMEVEPNIYPRVEPKCKVTHVKGALSLCHRFEAQRQIIAQQKEQLKHQKKIINDLTLENLSKDSKESVTKTLDQISSYTSPSKMHRKCSKDRRLNVGKEDLHVPPLSQTKTEEISSRREKWRELMRDRRDRISKERILKKEMELDEQRQIEEREKVRIAQEIRERNHQRMQAERKRRMARRKFEAALHAAKEFYNKKLLQKYGIQNLRKYLAIERERELLMKEYYKKRLVVKHFYEWLKYIRILNDYRRYVALSFYNRQLLKQGLKGFMKNSRGRDSDEQVAEDFRDMKLVEDSFNKWQLYAYWQQVANNNLVQEAQDLYRRKLAAKAFKAWRAHPQVIKEEREKERRKEYWRKKVREILPDFCPNMKGAN